LIIANTENIVLTRSLKGWNQKQLAMNSGLSAAAITKLEAGKSVSPETVKKIMQAFGSSDVEKYFCYIAKKNN